MCAKERKPKSRAKRRKVAVPRIVLITLAAGILGSLAIPSLAQTNYLCVLKCIDHGHLDLYCDAHCTNGGVPLPAHQTPVPGGQPAPQSPSGQMAPSSSAGQPASSSPPGQPAPQSPPAQSPQPPAGQTASPQAPAHSVFDIFKGTAPAAQPTPPGSHIDYQCELRCLDRHLDQYCDRVCTRTAPGTTASPAPNPAK